MNRVLACAAACAAILLVALTPGDVVAKEKPKAERPFVEETRIAARRRVGDFILEGSLYEETSKDAGVQFRYMHPDHPELRFDIFVYPAGEMPREKAMDDGMQAFTASFDAGVKLKYYDDLQILGTTDFEIVPASKIPEDASVLVLRAVESLRGKRIDLRYRMRIEDTGELVPMRSRGYLFYQQLHYFKSRITAAESRVPQDVYETLSDRAVRELVPAITAINIGGCGEMTVATNRAILDRTDEASFDDLVADMLGQLVSHSLRNCYESRADAKEIEPEDAEIVTIAYDADDWSTP